MVPPPIDINSEKFKKSMADDEAITAMVDFLELRKTSGIVSHTFLPWMHMGKLMLGKFYVKPEDRAELSALVAGAVATGRSIPLTEQLGDVAPLRVDIDLRLTEVVDVITDEYVDNIIKALDNGKGDVCYVMSKPPREVRKDGKTMIKHGVHLHFPDLLTNKEGSKKLRDHVIEELGDRLYPNDPRVIRTSLAEVYDVASAINNWFMYGCRKGDETSSWEVSRVVKCVDGKVENKKDDETNFTDLFSILENATWENKFKLIVDEPEPTPRRERPPSEIHTTEGVSVPAVKALVDMLKPSRAGPYDTWRDVCFSVLNIRDKYALDKDEIDDLLHDFSSKSEKYTERGCAKALVMFGNTRREKRFGIPYLKLIAKADNPEEFANAVKPCVDEALYDENGGVLDITLREMLDCDETDGVKDLLEKITRGKFKVVNNGGNYVFYHHNGVVWVPDNDLKTSRVHKYITRIQKAVSRAIDNLTVNPLNGEETADVKKELTRNNKKLRGNAFQKACVESSLKIFIDDAFRKNLNLVNKHLIAFLNGIYDLDAGVFREGRPDDYISLTTDYNYSPDEIQEIQLEIRNVFREIFSTEAEYQYFVSCIALFLHGDRGRTNNNLIWLYGEAGSNGKSTVVALISLMFGDLYVPLSSTIYTNPKFSFDPNAPNPVLAETRGKRFAEIGEIQDDSTLYSGMVKTLTSGTDRIRPLDKFEKGENGISFIPQFGQIAYSNVYPKIKAAPSDGGINRRMNTIKLIFEFVDEPTAPHHKKKDITLMARFATETYRQQMFLFFLKEYNKVKHLTGVPKPDEITAANRELADEHSPLANFLDEYTEKTIQVDSKGHLPYVSSTELFGMLTNSAHYSSYRPNQKQFTRDLKSRGIVATLGSWGPGRGKSVFEGIVIKAAEQGGFAM